MALWERDDKYEHDYDFWTQWREDHIANENAKRIAEYVEKQGQMEDKRAENIKALYLKKIEELKKGKLSRGPRRAPGIRKDDRVSTPQGPGKVYSIDIDGIVCVELDSDKDSNILYEFEKKEVEKLNKDI